jgi:phenylpyruvate tautomerase PptA (4-oxalocrotonate tautomerase family)
MPLLYVDLIGRAPKEIQALLDAIHDAVVEAFGVPPRERYQVVRTQPASPEMKQRFYELVAANLAARCGLDPADLIVSITDNGDEDWSFSYGRAQFLTGELT